MPDYIVPTSMCPVMVPTCLCPIIVSTYLCPIIVPSCLCPIMFTHIQYMTLFICTNLFVSPFAFVSTIFVRLFVRTYLCPPTCPFMPAYSCPRVVCPPLRSHLSVPMYLCPPLRSHLSMPIYLCPPVAALVSTMNSQKDLQSLVGK